MIVLVAFAFLAGLVTILSPCILPLLPIILSSSAAGGKRRPFGIMIGFVLSFVTAALALTFLVKSTGINQDTLRGVAIVVIAIFGLSMLIPKFTVWLEVLVSKLSGKVQLKGGGDGFLGGLFVGLSLGLVWTPCAGPILASVITLAATSSVTFEAVLITLAYALGTSIPMVGIIYGGRELINRVPFLLKNSAKIQKVFGVVILLVAFAMYKGYDKDFQVWVLDHFPQYGEGLTQLEQFDVVNDQLDRLNMTIYGEEEAGADMLCENRYPYAPEIINDGTWLNSESLTLQALRGKVVLVDFWTYSCINCIRTLPYLNDWHEQYADDGLVIIGVHAPEFEFEKSTENVQEALEKYDIKYPVVQDNDKVIWRNYKNRFWPAKYLVDQNGCIRYTHFGEGEYAETEEVIKELLGAEREGDSDLVEYQREGDKTPETYLGYGRMENFVGQLLQDQVEKYAIDRDLELDQWGYIGEWEVGEERAVAVKDAALEMRFSAKEVYLVMNPGDSGSGMVKVFVDGEEMDSVTVDSDSLYTLVSLEEHSEGLLRLEFDPGVEVYAFTFG